MILNNMKFTTRIFTLALSSFLIWKANHSIDVLLTYEVLSFTFYFTEIIVEIIEWSLLIKV